MSISCKSSKRNCRIRSQVSKKHKLKHYWNYPSYPKSNAYIERFNMPIKEQFVYRNEDWIEDCDLANQRSNDNDLGM
ncbi:MAG: hypothetical protein LBD61_04950 [Endomicrobium sp.]|nr:hypothetical protein [Endomicrobium sp.]